MQSLWVELLPTLNKIKEEYGDKWKEFVVLKMMAYIRSKKYLHIDRIKDIDPIMLHESENTNVFLNTSIQIKEELWNRFIYFRKLFTSYIYNKTKYE